MPSTKNNLEQHLTVEEIAARLAVHRRTIQRAITSGMLRPAPLVGNKFRVPESAVLDWLKRLEVRP